MVMIEFIDIISPIYQDLLKKCARRKISINLDFQDLTIKVADEDTVRSFYTTELRRALKLCNDGDKITLSQVTKDNKVRFSVKNSSKTPLDSDTVTTLREKGYEVRARFGYDTIITLVVEQ